MGATAKREIRMNRRRRLNKIWVAALFALWAVAMIGPAVLRA